MKPLLIAITFDTDNDLYLDHRSSDVTWKGIDEAPRLADTLRQYKDSAGESAKLTWFLRCDGQLERLHSSRLWLVDEYANDWKRFVAAGDELAWHPHLAKRPGTEWVPEKDEDAIIDDLRTTASAIQAHAWFHPFTVRLGWGVSSARILTELSQLGMIADSSAIPGRHELALPLKDWRGTPLRPYVPSVKDYRLPASPGARALPIVELPATTTLLKLPAEQQSKYRQLNLSYRPELLARPIRELVATEDVLVLVSHCYEFSDRLAPRTPNPLIAFSYDALRQNMDALVAACHEHHRPFFFKTAQQLAEAFPHE